MTDEQCLLKAEQKRMRKAAKRINDWRTAAPCIRPKVAGENIRFDTTWQCFISKDWQPTDADWRRALQRSWFTNARRGPSSKYT